MSAAVDLLTTTSVAAISGAVFGGAWILLIALAILLDWLGNPQRGRFRPTGARARNRAERRAIKRDWAEERELRDRAALAASPTWWERRRQRREAPMTVDEAAAVQRVLDRMDPSGQDQGHERAPAP